MMMKPKQTDDSIALDVSDIKAKRGLKLVFGKNGPVFMPDDSISIPNTVNTIDTTNLGLNKKPKQKHTTKELVLLYLTLLTLMVVVLVFLKS